MKKIVTVKGIKIGEEIPKICVPMVGKTLDELLEEANYIKTIDLDIVEWRVDFFEDMKNIDKVKSALEQIRETLVDKPIIFTIRSKKEGGHSEVSKEFYFNINKMIAKTKLADIIDVELFNDEEKIKELIEIAHKNDVKIILSSHDFHQTPSKDEIVSRMCKAIDLNCDIPKIAVMPNNSRDVLTLLNATRIMNEECSNRPIIAISMGKLGLISRLTGEIFGSSLTFASAKNTSAPGLISVEDLSNIIKLIHRNI